MNRWFSSDYHLGHRNVIKFCNRPFSSLAEMNDTIISNHNSVVKPEDEFYFLGDFAFGSRGYIESLLRRLNGKKFFVFGNHDKEIRKHSEHFIKENLIKSVSPLMEITVQDKEQPQGKILITLCHYAMKVWNRSHYGSYCLYGHSHGKLPEDKTLSFDVGVDANNFFPVSYEEIKKRMFLKKNAI